MYIKKTQIMNKNNNIIKYKKKKNKYTKSYKKHSKSYKKHSKTYKKYSKSYKKKYTNKHIKKITYNKTQTKYIYIKNNAGFGNKVFYLIFGIYLYNLYNKFNNKCIIYFVNIKSTHEKYNDPTLDKIFPKAKSKIIFITDYQYQKINNNSLIKINKDDEIMKKLSTFPTYEELSQYTKIDNNFRLVYEMYKTFSQQDKNIFNMNTKILNDKNTLYKITAHNYSLVHIRYGDKLHFLKQYINKPDINISTLINNKNITNDIDRFILYTPEYYIDKINELLNTTPNNMKIYIITESANIVNEFIMKQTSFSTNPRIILLDKMTWWDSFYLLYYASNIILSTSTFCFSGAYFNKKKANCELLIYHHNYNNPNISPDEYAISPYWKILNDKKYILNYKKYILNYNTKIAFEILKYKYQWTY